MKSIIDILFVPLFVLVLVAELIDESMHKGSRNKRAIDV